LRFHQGIITTSARQSQFPTPLCSTAEQVYLSALLQGYGAVDDSSMVRQYFAEPITKVSSTKSDEETAEALQLVLDLMEVTNLVAAAEAISFARYLNVDLKQFYTLVSDAAGASRQFMKKGLEIMEGLGQGANGDSETVDAASSRLEKAVQKARDLHCPLNLGNAALNVLFMAKRSGLGAEGSTSVVKVFEP
jgi:3-hydroxyisobutyrate dehydrogenase